MARQLKETPPSILDAIGSTPLINVEGIWAKLEYLNPSGSIKARIARFIIERAEREGLLQPGDTIVEASSGNTGNALSMVAAVKGYKMRVVTAAGLSDERLQISRGFGAEIEVLGDFHLSAAIDRATALGLRPGFYCPEQFESEWNVEENREWLGNELVNQIPTEVTIDAFVMGIGTGGTIVGVGQKLREKFPSVHIVGVEPDESCILLCGDVCRHAIEGIADGIVPGIIKRHRSQIDTVMSVPGNDAVQEMKRLARDHGLFVGPSSGAHMLIARSIADQGFSNVLTIFVDKGEKYLSEHFQ